MIREGLRRRLQEDSGPCGRVLDCLTVPIDGQPWQWHILRPAALLDRLCSINNKFGDLVAATDNVVMYADEIKPGNVLRPDKGREQLCFYWTLKELPSWFVSRDQGQGCL